MYNKFFSRDIFLILAASFFYMSSPMLVTPLIAGFSEHLGASAELMGIIGALMNICALFCRPFIGNLADKISKYRLTFLGAGLIFLSCMGYMISFSPNIVVVFRIINGLGYACCSVSISTWLANLLPKKKMGFGMGMYGTMNALAMALAPAIGITVYQSLGYRTAFVVAAIFAIFTLITIHFINDRGKVVIQKNHVRGHAFEIVDKDVIPVALIIMLFAIPYCATQSFLVSYIVAKNLSVNVSLFFPVYAVILLILRLSLKNLFDKKPFIFFMILSSISAFIGMSALTVMESNFMLLIGAMFMASGYGIMCSVCQSMAMILADKSERGVANSTYLIGFDIGMSMGAIIGGVLYGNVDIDFFYPVLMVTIPLGLIVYWMNRKRLLNL